MTTALRVLVRQGHKECVSISCKVNPASLSTLILRLCYSHVSPATACGFNDNKEIQQLGRCKREPWAQQYSLSDPHSRPHQSQSVSPNGNVPMCSRQGGRGGLTGGKGAPVVLLMTNRGSSQTEGVTVWMWGGIQVQGLVTQMDVHKAS